jgi:hypothetical protein
MTGHSLPEERIERRSLARDGRQFLAVAPSVTQEHHRGEGFLHPLRRPSHRLVEVLVRHPSGLGEIGTGELVAEPQIEQREIVGLETTTGGGDQLDELVGFDKSTGGAARLFEGVAEAHGITGKGFGTLAGVGVTLVSSDREEPRPDPFGFTELGQPRRRPDEHLVGDIGSVRGRTGEAGAEVVDLRTEPVIELPKRLTVSLRDRRGHLGVAGSAERPGHGDQA